MVAGGARNSHQPKVAPQQRLLKFPDRGYKVFGGQLYCLCVWGGGGELAPLPHTSEISCEISCGILAPFHDLDH
jgi:hypothetical protein